VSRDEYLSLDERTRLVLASARAPDPVLKERSVHLAEMNRVLHALPLGSPERYRYAMSMADYILTEPKR
jgi:hypothetical protein